MPAARPHPPASRALWHRNVRDLEREHGFQPLGVEGKLPDGLAGTLYRNGPALFSNFGEPYRHWFDGDGGVSAVRIGANGAAEGAIRLVQSAGLLAERKAKRVLGANYGSMPAGFFAKWRAPKKNTANTSVMVWQGRLFALQEGSRPTELDPATLGTLGESDLSGVVGRTFSAHPHYVPSRKAAYNFGTEYGPNTSLSLYELPDAGPARRIGTVPLAGPTMIHDFIATANHLVFFAPPLRLNIFRLLLRRAAFADCLAWKPEEGTQVLVVPIDRPHEAVSIDAEPFFQWHFANAFERGGEVVVDYVRYPDFSSNRWLSGVVTGNLHGALDGRYHRAVLDPNTRNFRTEERWDVRCEFPRIASRRLASEHRRTYLASYKRPEDATAGLPNQLSTVDVEAGRATNLSFGDETYPSEPVFVGRPGATDDDDGWLLAHVYDGAADRTFVAVVDAKDLESGPIAKLHFDQRLPFTFHGFWQRG